jgi:hypothetical protein
MFNSRRRNAIQVGANVFLAAVLLISPAFSAPNRQFKSDKEAADSFQKKVDFIRENASASSPVQQPTTFSQEEVNAYFAERRLKVPDGVQTVTFDLAPSQVTASTRVDFEKLRNSRPSMNPLLAIFDGVHDCKVVAHTDPAGPGMVRVRVESVVIDGMEVPRMALELFIKHYVNPKYPDVSLENTYRLPARIDSAVIAQQAGTITQK